jgi:hypothetical protein
LICGRCGRDDEGLVASKISYSYPDSATPCFLSEFARFRSARRKRKSPSHRGANRYCQFSDANDRPSYLVIGGIAVLIYRENRAISPEWSNLVFSSNGFPNAGIDRKRLIRKIGDLETEYLAQIDTEIWQTLKPSETEE